MFGTGVNFWAVLACAIANNIIGMFWYGSLFGKQWMAQMVLKNKSQKEAEKMKKAAGKGYVLTFIGSLLTAWVLGIFFQFMGIAMTSTGIYVAILAWIGFFFPLLMGSVLWEGKSIKLLWINAGYYLFS